MHVNYAQERSFLRSLPWLGRNLFLLPSYHTVFNKSIIEATVGVRFINFELVNNVRLNVFIANFASCCYSISTTSKIKFTSFI